MLIFLERLSETKEYKLNFMANIQHTLRGFSGNNIQILKVNKYNIVRKISNSISQNKKLNSEIEKLHELSKIGTKTKLFDVPSILSHGINNNGLAFYEMTFVPGETLDTHLKKLGPDDIKKFANLIYQIIITLSKHENKKIKSNLHSSEHDYLLQKLLETSIFLKNKKFSLFTQKLIRDYNLHVEKLVIKPKHLTNRQTFCHGDLSLDNMLISRKGLLFLIDPLSNNYENFVWDISKVLQSSLVHWNLIKLNKFQIINSKKSIKLKSNDNIMLFNYHFQNCITDFDSGRLILYLAVTLSRIVKYAETGKQINALLIIINELLDNYKIGRYRLDECFNSLCR